MGRLQVNPNIDLYFNNVSLLLPFDNNFQDYSKNNFNVTVNGDAQISTTQFKYGGASAYFDGDVDYLQITNNSKFDYGLGDFTVEMWVYLLDVDTYAQGLVCTTENGGMDIQYEGAGKFLGIGNHLVSWEHQFSWTPSANTWYHVAVCRSNGNTKAFINGQQIGSTKDDSSKEYSLNGGNLNIGLGDNYLNGYIDDLRITKGIARYTSNFTPPSKLRLNINNKISINKQNLGGGKLNLN